MSRMLLRRKKLIELEQADIKDQRERHLALHRADDPRSGLDGPDRGLECLQTLGVDEIALVEQDHIAVDELIAGSLALEQFQAKACGIRDRDDRIDAHR